MSHAIGQLVEQLRSLPSDRLIARAWPALSTSNDPAAILALIRAFTAQGMPLLAARFLEGRLDRLDSRETRSLISDLRRASTDEVLPIGSARAADRIEAMLADRPHLHPLRERLTVAAAGVAIHQSRERNRFVVGVEPNELRFVLPPLDWTGQAASFSWPAITLNTAFLVLGVPGAALWSGLLERGSAENFRPPIDLIEPSLQALAGWLMSIDEVESLAGQRVGIYAGEEAETDYREALERETSRMLPTECLRHQRQDYEATPLAASWYRPLVQKKRDREATLRSQQRELYVDRDSEMWQESMRAVAAGSRPLRAVGITTRHSSVIRHAMRDLGDAFQSRGWNLDIVCEAHAHTSYVDTFSALAKRNYDVAFVFNHLRGAMGDRIDVNLPLVSWIQDSIPDTLTADAGRSLGPLDVVLCHSPGMMAGLYDYPADRLIGTSNLTNPRLFSDSRLPEAELAPHRCDVSYVGHGAAGVGRLVDEMRDLGGDVLARIATHFVQLVKERLAKNRPFSWYDLFPAVLEAERASNCVPFTPEIRRSHLQPQMARLYDRLLRHETLEWVAEWAEAGGKRFHLYGRGWEEHPKLGRFACGPVEYGRALRAVYQASSINLQVSGYQSLHQRLLDAAVSGGFVLSRYHPKDFAHAPLGVIERTIADRRITSLAELVDAALGEPELNDAIRPAEALGCLFLRPMTDPQRRVQARLMGTEFDDQMLASDEALFENLRRGGLRAHRGAGGIDGFGEAVFGSRDELHRQLDRFATDRCHRRAVARRMRENILRHDTYDRLLDRLLGVLTGELAARFA